MVFFWLSPALASSNNLVGRNTFVLVPLKKVAYTTAFCKSNADRAVFEWNAGVKYSYRYIKIPGQVCDSLILQNDGPGKLCYNLFCKGGIVCARGGFIRVASFAKSTQRWKAHLVRLFVLSSSLFKFLWREQQFQNYISCDQIGMMGGVYYFGTARPICLVWWFSVGQSLGFICQCPHFSCLWGSDEKQESSCSLSHSALIRDG